MAVAGDAGGILNGGKDLMEDIESGPPARRLIGISKMLSWMELCQSTRDRDPEGKPGQSSPFSIFDPVPGFERRRKM